MFIIMQYELTDNGIKMQRTSSPLRIINCHQSTLFQIQFKSEYRY